MTKHKNKPSASQSPPDLKEEIDAARREAESSPDRQAQLTKTLRDESGSMYLRGIGDGTHLAVVPMEALQAYVKEFVRDSIGCDPEKHPLLRTLAEQVVLMHHTIGRLQSDGCGSKDLETRRTNIQLAASLAGELRRLTKELRDQVAMSQTGPSPAVKVYREQTESKKKHAG